MADARIQFKGLKGFPATEQDKIETQAFLNASKEIVTVIGKLDRFNRSIIQITVYLNTPTETFGKLFTPVIKDMNGNINVSPRKPKYVHAYV